MRHVRLAVCQNRGVRFRLRKAVEGVRPYSPGKPIEEVVQRFDLSCVTKLASNENPLGPSPLAVEAIREAAAEAHRYPDSDGTELKKALSTKLGCPQECIVLGNGSDEIIQYLSLALLDAGDEVIVGDPSFVRYNACSALMGAEVVRVPLDADDRHNLDAMAERISPRTKVVWIANPNNPTGTIISRRSFERLLASLPADITVVLDEAYFQFVDDPDNPNSIQYVVRDLPVVGLRTFSKTYGLAGVRIGYGIMPGTLAEALERIRPPFNTSFIAQKAAIAALKDEEHLRASIALNKQALERISLLMRSIGARVTKSYANFVWADLGRPAGPMFEALLSKGVIVRTGDMFGRPNCLRISAGTPAQLDHLEEALFAITNERTCSV